MSLYQTISSQKTLLLLLTSIAAYKVIFLPSCISKLGSKVSHPNVVCGCICASITSACTAIYIWHKRKGSISKWKLLFSFGARLAGVRFVERYIDDPNDATNALRIIQTMVKTDKHMHKFVVELGGIETTVKAMKRYSQDHDGVAASGSGLVSAICGYDASTDRKLMDCGAIRALVQAMEHWPDNEEVQAYASEALNRLASNKSRDIRKKIIDVGGLVALAQAKTKHQHDARVNSQAANAIILLVSQESGNVLDTKLMRRMNDNDKVRVGPSKTMS